MTTNADQIKQALDAFVRGGKREVSSIYLSVEPGTKHIHLMVDKATGEVMHIAQFAEDELKQTFLKIGQVLGVQLVQEPPSPAATAPQIAGSNGAAPAENEVSKTS